MSAWGRSPFAMSGAEQEVHEAIMALLRVLQHADVSESARFAIQGALDVLRAQQDATSSDSAKFDFSGRTLSASDEAPKPSPRPGWRPVRT